MTPAPDTKKPFVSSGLRLDHFMRFFFGGNASVTVIVLALITFFLFREGAGFFPENYHGLRIYRLAGLEYVDYIRVQTEHHTALTRALQELRLRQLDVLKNKDADQVNAELAGFDKFAGDYDEAIEELRALVSDLTETTTAIKEKAKIREDMIEKRQALLTAGRRSEAAEVQISEIDFAKEVAPVTATLPLFHDASLRLEEKMNRLLAEAPVLPTPRLKSGMEKLKSATRKYLAEYPAVEAKMGAWNPREPIPWYRTITSFLFGREWITNSFWQDFYGVVPLLVGSVMVSAVALMIAVPFGVCSAVYVSEMATLGEQRFIKPYIEFISAIPSVVLGFFGIAVLGETIRWVTQLPILSWVPFFPISERLNVFTAGALLALMAIPTIFSLSEDALNNVPRAFKEASYALGATRLQTIVRILIPASLSGIVSAVLLGLGRVIGETMVVLLCAGNRIAIPDFTEGPGALFQPVHTMTGIVAQEMGEVVRGSIHYRALFMVGVVLFFLSLLINYLAQFVVRKFKISIG